MTEQETLNRVAKEQLIIAAANGELDGDARDFAAAQIARLESANSNATYEQCQRLLQFNGDESIKFEEIIGYINRKIQRCGMEAISRRFVDKFLDKFHKIKEHGQYRKLDVILFTENLC